MKSTFLLDSILLAVAKSRAADQHQSIDNVISNLCREFLEMQASKVELVYDEKLGIKTLPSGSRSTPVTFESVRLIIDQMDELDALRAWFVPQDESIELTIDDDIVEAIVDVFAGNRFSIDVAISQAASAMLPLDEEIRAYESARPGANLV